jgi:hypothetical protein
MAKIKYLEYEILDEGPESAKFQVTCKACKQTWTERFVYAGVLLLERDAYNEMHLHDNHECTKPEKLGDRWVRVPGQNDQGEDAEVFVEDEQ